MRAIRLMRRLIEQHGVPLQQVKIGKKKPFRAWNAVGVGMVGLSTAGYLHEDTESPSLLLLGWPICPSFTPTGCDFSVDANDDTESYDGPTSAEAEEFRQSLYYYRQQLPWYKKDWNQTANTPLAKWPHHVPSEAEISAMEFDLSFCQRHPLPGLRTEYDAHCQKLEFRAALYYLRSKNGSHQYNGYKMIKKLAEHGHADAMCLYGIVLSEGQVGGLDANPEEAVVWWKRCIDEHGHIQAMYEYGIALYMGEGVEENPSAAVEYFYKAANLHVGAAYMLGECLLDGIGTTRRRAAALEWLVVAAELGHRGAQRRVFSVLQATDDELDRRSSRAVLPSPNSAMAVTASRRGALERRFTLGGGENTLERRYTIGGGSGNVHVNKRRHSIVEESRGGSSSSD